MYSSDPNAPSGFVDMKAIRATEAVRTEKARQKNCINQSILIDRWLVKKWGHIVN